MERHYRQLSLEERCQIASLQAEGRSIRQIATDLDRTPSTISRELKRNRGIEVGYKPSYAQEQTKARRWVGSRLDREPVLRHAVLERLAAGWSPEQVAGRLDPALFVDADHPGARAEGADGVQKIWLDVLASPQDEEGVGSHQVLSLRAEQPKLGAPALLLELPDGLELVVVG